MLILLLSVFIVTLNACVAATSIQETLSDEMLQTNQQRNFLRSRNSNDDGVNLQQQPQPLPQQQRVATGEFYRTNSSSILGAPNYMAAIGNPLKGLVGFGPREYLQQSLPDNVPSAIEKYNLGLNEIMIGDDQFNWTEFDQLVAASASRKMHSVFSIFIHWPFESEPLRLPLHLLDLPLVNTNYGKSPDYGNPRLLRAIEQFILAWGRHSDGDTRIAAVHVGLLGFWGEGHTYPDTTLVPESSTQSVAEWYRMAFTKTHVQTRYPGPSADGFGFFDASLAYSTLDGEANGGVQKDWYMYPQMVAENQQNNWKQSMMGGETRPELQGTIFTAWYPKGTEHHQDLRACVDALHISYIVHQDAFVNDGYTGDVQNAANEIHAYMGYSFYVSEVAASQRSTLLDQSVVDVSVSISQQGVAPFYYDLGLVFECDNGAVKMLISGVDKIVERGTSNTFTFTNVPTTADCLDNVTLSLYSSYAYPDRPVRFGQGTNGAVTLQIPLPLNHSETGVGSIFSILFSPFRNFFKSLLKILF